MSQTSDDQLLQKFGYTPKLSRSVGWFSSFAISFSLVSVTTGIFASYGYGLTTAGPRFIWSWPIVAIGQLLIALVLAHLSTRVPIAGYAFQWSSKMVSPKYGWFSGWMAVAQFLTGMTGVAYALSSYIDPYIGLGSSTSTIVISTMVFLVIWAIINIVGIKVASRVNSISVYTEIIGGVLLGGGLLIVALVHPINPESFIFSRGNVPSAGYFMAFAMSALVGAYTIMGFEGAADLAEETINPIRRVPQSIIWAEVISAVAGFLMLLGFTMAIPNLEAAQQSPVPLLYIMSYYLGPTLSTVAMLVVFISIFACGLMNMTATSRFIFSLARDHMLPASSFLGQVNKKWKTPSNAIIVITIFACLVILSAKLEFIITSISSVAAAIVYGLVIVAGLLNKKYDAPPDSFSLGRWYRPISYLALLWILVLIAALTLPAANNINGYSTIGVIALGIIWYFAGVKRRVEAGVAGFEKGEKTPLHLDESVS